MAFRLFMWIVHWTLMTLFDPKAKKKAKIDDGSFLKTV